MVEADAPAGAFTRRIVCIAQPGRVFAAMDPEPLRQMLRSVHHRLRRNKALLDGGEQKIAAVDGHEFFSQ